MQVCTLLQTDNHASTSPLCFLQAGCPSCRPTNSVKALKANTMRYIVTDVCLPICLSLCICLCVCHGREPCKNCWTDRDAVSPVDLAGPRNHALDGAQIPHRKRQFWGFSGPLKSIIKHRMSACPCVENNMSLRSNSHGIHIDATWRIRLIDPCGGCDAYLCYHYCSNLLRWELAA